MTMVYCSKCKSDVKEYGVVAEVVYEHVCNWYAKKGKPVVMSCKELQGICCRRPVVDFLEKKGYLVTTEYGMGSIAIKPNGCCGRH